MSASINTVGPMAELQPEVDIIGRRLGLEFLGDPYQATSTAPLLILSSHRESSDTADCGSPRHRLSFVPRTSGLVLVAIVVKKRRPTCACLSIDRGEFIAS